MIKTEVDSWLCPGYGDSVWPRTNRWIPGCGPGNGKTGLIHRLTLHCHYCHVVARQDGRGTKAQVLTKLTINTFSNYNYTISTDYNGIVSLKFNKIQFEFSILDTEKFFNSMSMFIMCISTMVWLIISVSIMLKRISKIHVELFLKEFDNFFVFWKRKGFPSSIFSYSKLYVRWTRIMIMIRY